MRISWLITDGRKCKMKSEKCKMKIERQPRMGLNFSSHRRSRWDEASDPARP
jgi:hypothetical protein